MFVLGFSFGLGNADYYASDDSENKRYQGLGKELVKFYYSKVNGEEA